MGPGDSEGDAVLFLMSQRVDIARQDDEGMFPESVGNNVGGYFSIFYRCKME
jgi:hypothetical protein